MREHIRQPSTRSLFTPSPAPWWYALFTHGPGWRGAAWFLSLTVAGWVGLRPYNDWPQPLAIGAVLLAILCWLSINVSLVIQLAARGPMQPAWAKPILVAAIVCVTAVIAIQAGVPLWVADPSSAWLLLCAALLALAFLLFVVSTMASMMSEAVRSR